MTMKIEDELLKEVGLRGEDAARLVLEVIEALGKRASGLGREQLMEEVRAVLRAGLAERVKKENTVSFEQAAWGSVEARADLRPVYKRDLRYYVRRMLRGGEIGEKPLRAVSMRDCRAMLTREWGKTPHGYRKARTILHSIFAYGRGQEWCDENPVDGIPGVRVREQPIEPLDMSAVRRLDAAAHLPQHSSMCLSLYLMLYCGLRPTEVQRLRPEDIDWVRRIVIVRPQTSKTGGGRMVPLRLPRGLRRELRVIPGCWKQRWRALRSAAGFRKWRPDTLRHTFASYHLAAFGNYTMLQVEMGHRDVELLRTRYTSPISQQDARCYWQLGRGKA